jgi:uncharacterized protein YjiS (DUF1127 family)
LGTGINSSSTLELPRPTTGRTETYVPEQETMNRDISYAATPIPKGKTMTLTRIAGPISAYLKRRYDERHLQSLPDYLLKDIGIHRSEVRSVLHHKSNRRRA